MKIRQIFQALGVGFLAACTQPSAIAPTLPDVTRGNVAKTGPLTVRIGNDHTLVLVTQIYQNPINNSTDWSVSGYGPYLSTTSQPVFKFQFRPLAGYPPATWGPNDVGSDSSGRVYVTGGLLDPPINPGLVAIYDSPLTNPTTPSQLIYGRNTGLTGALHGYQLAVDGVGRIYVTVSAFAKVFVFPALAKGDVAPIGTIEGPNTGLNYCPAGSSDCTGSALSIRVDSSGNIYVGGENQISVFAARRFGNVAPMRVIRGSSTNLGWVVGIALGRDGTIYASNYQPSESNVPGVITEYAPGANGNVSPIRTISGSQTGLFDPLGIAVCADGTLYVANNVQNREIPTTHPRNVEIFSPYSNGNVAPDLILGAKAGIRHPLAAGF